MSWTGGGIPRWSFVKQAARQLQIAPQLDMERTMTDQPAINEYERMLYKSVGIAVNARPMEVRSGNERIRVTSSAEVRDAWFEGKKLVLSLAAPGGTSSMTIIKGRGSPGLIESEGVGISANVSLDAVTEGFRYLPEADVLIIKVAHPTRTPMTVRIGRFP